MIKNRSYSLGTLLLAGALGVASVERLGAQTNSMPSLALSKPEQSFFSADMTTAFVSKFVRKGGAVIGEGPDNLTSLSLTAGDHITGTAVEAYDFSTGKVDELDLKITANFKIGAIGNGPFKGTFSGGLGFEYWGYPSRVISKHEDHVWVPTFTYDGPFRLTISDLHLLDGGYWTWGRNCVVVNLSTHFNIVRFGENMLLLTPSVQFACKDRFSNDNGPSYLAPGLSMSWKHAGFSLTAFLNDQRRISDKVKNSEYFGVYFEEKLGFLRR